MPDSRSDATISPRLVTALDRTWDAIQDRHADVPAVVIAVGAGSDGRQLKLGHFAAERWQRGEGRIPELFIGGRGAREGRPGCPGHFAARGRARRGERPADQGHQQARPWATRRFPSGPTASGVTPFRLAYADPPYPGKAFYYRDHADYGGEVDHAALIEQLAAYDGWALSTSAEALPAVLALCPPGVRVAAWVRGERPGRGDATLQVGVTQTRKYVPAYLHVNVLSYLAWHGRRPGAGGRAGPPWPGAWRRLAST